MMSREMLESIIFDRRCGYICCTNVVSIEAIRVHRAPSLGSMWRKGRLKLVRYGRYQAGREYAMMR